MLSLFFFCGKESFTGFKPVSFSAARSQPERIIKTSKRLGYSSTIIAST
jgi:hypothetical protein